MLRSSNDSALFVWLENGLDDVKNADENVMACKSRKSGAIRPVPKDSGNHDQRSLAVDDRPSLVIYFPP